MQLPGLITVQPHQQDLIQDLATMMGTSFMEEEWTRLLLRGLDSMSASDERKLAISRAIFACDFDRAVPLQACYTTEDLAACAGGYLASELGDTPWAHHEEQSFNTLINTVLTDREAQLISQQIERMEAISNISWEIEAAQGSDFIHFFALGVDPDKRGSGAFRRLVEPFFAYADEQGIPCFLETYSDKLESLYTHMGFHTIEVLRSPHFDLAERCMMRDPQ